MPFSRRRRQRTSRILWNGTYFNYDQGSTYHTDIMAEQLAGQWYSNLTGLGDLVPAQMRKSALQRVYDYNVMKFQNGEMGAINGMSADGQALHENEQVEEVWTGTTFAIASHMLSEGMREQAFRTRARRLQRRLEGSRILLPHSGSLRRARHVPRQHVHEARSHLVDGASAEIARGCTLIRTADRHRKS